MKRLLPLVIFVAGCGPTAPALTLHEECRLGAWLALHVAREAPPLKVPSPDKPDQGDTCEECGGTGKLGDGTVFVKCGACNGTGKKPAAAFDTPAEAEAFKAAEAPKPAAPTPPPAAAKPIAYRKVCRNGVCTLEPIP
jgi:hypothetical protein